MVDDKILEQVRQLLLRANDPASSEAEREGFLRHANLKMTRHAIDQAMLDASRTSGEKRKPTQKTIQLFDEDFQWATYFHNIIVNIARTNRCQVGWSTYGESVVVVGMQDDVDWVEMLWMSVFLSFSSQINPRWDNEKPLQENIFQHKHAGYKWKDIWEIGNRNRIAFAGRGMPDDGSEFVPAKCGYMKSMYHKECKSRGVQPVGTQTFKAYKITFTTYFTYRVSERLEEMRAANKEAEADTNGSTVALFDLSQQINDLFFSIFPGAHPDAQAKRELELLTARREREEADARYLAGLSPEARRAVLKARSDEEARQAKLNDRWFKQQAKVRTYDAAGASAGNQAGGSVNLTRSAPSTTSGSRTELNG